MVVWAHRITEVKSQYRVTLPKKLVEWLGWEKGDVLAISRLGKDQIQMGLTAKGVTFESGISKRKNGAGRPAERFG